MASGDPRPPLQSAPVRQRQKPVPCAAARRAIRRRGGLASLEIALGRLRHHDRSGRRQALDRCAVMRAGEVGHPRLKREIAGLRLVAATICRARR